MAAFLSSIVNFAFLSVAKFHTGFGLVGRTQVKPSTVATAWVLSGQHKGTMSDNIVKRRVPLDAEVKTLEEFVKLAEIHDGRFTVPGIQRDYEWDTARAMALVDSVFSNLPSEEGKSVFTKVWLNTMLLFQEGERGSEKLSIKVYDGQQRLMTLMITAAALYWLAKEEAKLNDADRKGLENFIWTMQTEDGNKKERRLKWHENSEGKKTKTSDHFHALLEWFCEENYRSKCDESNSGIDFYEFRRLFAVPNASITSYSAVLVNAGMILVKLRKILKEPVSKRRMKDMINMFLNNVELTVVTITGQRRFALTLFRTANSFTSLPFTPEQLVRVYSCMSVEKDINLRDINDNHMTKNDDYGKVTKTLNSIREILTKKTTIGCDVYSKEEQVEMMEKALEHLRSRYPLKSTEQNHNLSLMEYFMAHMDEIATKATHGVLQSLQILNDYLLELDMYKTPRADPELLNKYHQSDADIGAKHKETVAILLRMKMSSYRNYFEGHSDALVEAWALIRATTDDDTREETESSFMKQGMVDTGVSKKSTAKSNSKNTPTERKKRFDLKKFDARFRVIQLVERFCIAQSLKTYSNKSKDEIRYEQSFGAWSLHDDLKHLWPTSDPEKDTKALRLGNIIGTCAKRLTLGMDERAMIVRTLIRPDAYLQKVSNPILTYLLLVADYWHCCNKDEKKQTTSAKKWTKPDNYLKEYSLEHIMTKVTAKDVNWPYTNSIANLMPFCTNLNAKLSTYPIKMKMRLCSNEEKNRETLTTKVGLGIAESIYVLGKPVRSWETRTTKDGHRNSSSIDDLEGWKLLSQELSYYQEEKNAEEKAKKDLESFKKIKGAGKDEKLNAANAEEERSKQKLKVAKEKKEKAKNAYEKACSRDDVMKNTRHHFEQLLEGAIRGLNVCKILECEREDGTGTKEKGNGKEKEEEVDDVEEKVVGALKAYFAILPKGKFTYKGSGKGSAKLPQLEEMTYTDSVGVKIKNPATTISDFFNLKCRSRTHGRGDSSDCFKSAKKEDLEILAEEVRRTRDKSGQARCGLLYDCIQRTMVMDKKIQEVGYVESLLIKGRRGDVSAAESVLSVLVKKLEKKQEELGRKVKRVGSKRQKNTNDDKNNERGKEEEYLWCFYCGRKCKGEKGLQIHHTKAQTKEKTMVEKKHVGSWQSTETEDQRHPSDNESSNKGTDNESEDDNDSSSSLTSETSDEESMAGVSSNEKERQRKTGEGASRSSAPIQHGFDSNKRSADTSPSRSSPGESKRQRRLENPFKGEELESNGKGVERKPVRGRKSEPKNEKAKKRRARIPGEIKDYIEKCYEERLEKNGDENLGDIAKDIAKGLVKKMKERDEPGEGENWINEKLKDPKIKYKRTALEQAIYNHWQMYQKNNKKQQKQP